LIHAGDAVLDLHNSDGRMKLDSAGLVSALFKVDDTYTVRFEPSFCAAESQMDSKEGKRHRQTTVTYDRTQSRATWVEHDVLDNNKVLRRAQWISRIAFTMCWAAADAARVNARTGAIDAHSAERWPPRAGESGCPGARASDHAGRTFKTIRYE
jgi:hypothetical protein